MEKITGTLIKIMQISEKNEIRNTIGDIIVKII